MGSKNSKVPSDVPNMSRAFNKLRKRFATTKGSLQPGNRPADRVLSLLEKLPLDIHYTLLDFLDPTTSAALAIACPTFYQIHQERHGSVPLRMIEEKSAGVVLHGSLHELLADWMGKEGVELKFSWYNKLFVSKERWQELDEAMWSDGWESS
ncbi:hypothetical protein N431DRAFT_506780 [Stipitochalara longipes BDJ]|nr:hypothetical protein N431DRAFT_506780 [Stipitochalara longipes BDJ]